MIPEKIEGTIIVDGLLQGRLPVSEDLARRVREWIQSVGTLGVRFTLDESHDSQFSLLPDNDAIPVTPLGDRPEETIAQAVEQLVGLIDRDKRRQLFSTLRSSEVRSSEEVQSLYLVEDGAVRVESRIVPARTKLPMYPKTIASHLGLGLIGLLAAAVILGVAMVIPGVRTMVGQVVETVRPFHPEETEIDEGPYRPFISCQVSVDESDRNAVVLVVSREKRYPTTEAEFDVAVRDAISVKNRLAVENLLRSHLRAELFDRTGALVGTTELRIQEFGEHEHVHARIRLPNKSRVSKIVLCL